MNKHETGPTVTGSTGTQTRLEGTRIISDVELLLVSESTVVGLEVDSLKDRYDDEDDGNLSEGRKYLRFAPAPADTKGHFRFEKDFLPFMVRRLGKQDLKAGTRVLMVRPRRANTEGTGERVIVVGDCENSISEQK